MRYDEASFDVESFRREVRTWIGGNAPPRLSESVDWYAGATILAGANSPTALMREEAMTRDDYRLWESRLLDANLICPQWPDTFGGRGWGELQNSIFSEECRKAGVPRVRRGLGELLVGPAILAHGTDDQKMAFLPPIVGGEHRYCQGFSEPDHGSDLAALSTRGVVEGDELVITGQKVWTSVYRQANRMFVLCRTDPDAPKHKGLTYVLADFSTANGFDAQPVTQMTGSAEFAQVFIDGARAPLENVIGGLGNGWAVTLSTLAYERADGATIGYMAFADELEALIDVARENGSASDATVRQGLAWAHTNVALMRFRAMELARQLVESTDPGPQLLSSKLIWSEYHRSFGELVMRVLQTDGMVRPDGDGYPTTRWLDVFLASRAATIFSGTSEIQRNIIAERVLGLPREPRAEPARSPSAARSAGSREVPS